MSWLITGTQKTSEGIPWDQLGNKWTPADITTALWLDAADATTVTTVSNAVSQWNDKSGNGRNVLQGTASNRPALTAADLNGKDVFTFDGNDFLTTSSNFPLTGNAAFSAFYVVKPGSESSGSVLGWGNMSTALGGSGYYQDTGTTGWAYSGGVVFFVTRPTLNQWHIQAFTKAPGAVNTTSAAFRNGANVTGTGHSSSTPNIVSNTFSVGRWGSISGAALIGSMAEVIVTNSSASTPDRQRIEGYLAHKWGLTANLPNDHPYKTAAPTA
jgi:hypothetical protein